MALTVLMLILAGVIASLPLFVSSSTVRSYIVSELENLTGRDVTFRGDPRVSFSPFLGIEINDLIVADPMASDGEAPLLNVTTVQAQLDIIPALFGNIKITQYRLVSPRLNLKVYSDGVSSWQFKKGNLSEVFKATQSTISDENAPKPEAADLGTFTIEDGAIRYEDTIDGTTEIVTSMNGTIIWPTTSDAASIEGSAVWHGENVSSKLNFTDPAMLLAGGESSLRLSFDSAPAKIAFDGAANMLASLFVKGNLNLQTPSLRRFSEFFLADLSEIYLPGAIAVSGNIEATSEFMRISDAEMSIAGHSATGVLSLSNDELGNGSVDGTLAFDSIDFTNIFAESAENITNPQDIRGLKVDLRVSANSIDTGFLKLNDVAAALNATGENWIFDIGDSTTLGGNLIAKISERSDDGSSTIHVEVSASDVDATEVSALIPEKLLGLTGTGNFTASLRSNSLTELLGAKGLNGSISASLVDGSIVGIDIPGLLKGEAEGGIAGPAESELGERTTFESARFNLTVNNGISSVSNSTIAMEDTSIRLFGRVDLRRGNLAIRAQELTDQGLEPERLFIGGTLQAPLVSLKKSEVDPRDNQENASDQTTISN